MRVVTLLNRIEKFKSSVYKKVYLEEVDGKEAVIIEVRPRKNSPPVCRVCMKRIISGWPDRTSVVQGIHPGQQGHVIRITAVFEWVFMCIMYENWKA